MVWFGHLNTFKGLVLFKVWFGLLKTWDGLMLFMVWLSLNLEIAYNIYGMVWPSKKIVRHRIGPKITPQLSLTGNSSKKMSKMSGHFFWVK